MIHNPPLKWHGGKFKIARHIHDLAATYPHTHRVYLFGGGAGELWNWPHEGVSEHYNDVDEGLYCLFSVLRSSTMFPKFVRLCQATEFGEEVWEAAGQELRHPIAGTVQAAWAFFVRVRMSLAGRQDSFAPPSRSRTRRSMNEQASAWLSAVEGLPEVHERLKRLYVTCDDAIDLIAANDEPGVLLYADPPYHPDTRTAPAVYRHEYTDDQHFRLLTCLSRLRHAKFILSGYDSPMYRGVESVEGWGRREIDVDNKSAGGKAKARRTEVLWYNWEAA